MVNSQKVIIKDNEFCLTEYKYNTTKIYQLYPLDILRNRPPEMFSLSKMQYNHLKDRCANAFAPLNREKGYKP